MISLFGEQEQSRVFGIAPGCDFSAAFLEGLKNRLEGHPPEALAKTVILTNTRRAKRRWEELLTSGGPALLPKIQVISDLGSDPTLIEPQAKAETTLSKQLFMMQAVRKLLESGHSIAPTSAAFDLANSLLSLLDELDGAGEAAGTFSALDLEDHSLHWQTSLNFLKIIEDASLASGATIAGSDAAQRIAVETLIEHWQTNPPAHPVLVAGSTGSRPTTARLMAAVTTLPQGGVILPGFDFDLDRESWKELEDTKSSAIDHPQYGFAELASKLETKPSDVQPWGAHRPFVPARNALVSLAMCPAPVTSQWLSKGPDHLAHLDEATGDISLLIAPNERFEAAAIAVALRQAVDQDKRAVLITPDATLSRRVTTELGRWGIVPDDSAGVPLRFTPPAIFFDLLLQVDSLSLRTTDFLGILKHPLCAGGWDRGKHLSLARHLDAEKLRNMGPEIDWDVIWAWAKDDEDAQAWVNWLHTAMNSLTLPASGALSEFASTHQKTAVALVAGPDDGSHDELWNKNAGAKMREVFTKLSAEDAAAGEVSAFDYGNIFRALVSAETVREEGFVADKRVAIWGQLEARVQSADLVILGGLNEGTWPKLPSPDPWLSRQMRKALGLQLPERRIGLAAHDFQQAVANAEVILSRSEKVENTPTVASRWLKRIENLLQGIGETGKTALRSMELRGQRYINLAQAMDVPQNETPRCDRPCPAPAVTHRPNRISVTQVERLIRDPYAVYAEKVLRLRPLPELGRSADARDRGISFHKVFENFIDAIPNDVPDDAAHRLLEIAEQTLLSEAPWPSERRIWLGRLRRIADSFVAREVERRAIASPKFREVGGQVPIPNQVRDLKLTCQADRIDLTHTGEIAIYDYKSSLPTTDKQSKLFSKQLELEAYMALKGGFDGLDRTRATHLEIIGLSKPGAFEVLDSDPDVITQMWDEFLKLVAHFEDSSSGYAARLRPMRADQPGDYDHLARRGEWEDNDDFTAVPVP